MSEQTPAATRAPPAGGAACGGNSSRAAWHALCAEELPEWLALRPDSPAQDLGDHGGSYLHGWVHPCCPYQIVQPILDRHGHLWYLGWTPPDPAERTTRKQEEVQCHLLYSDFRLPPPVYCAWLMEKVSTLSSPEDKAHTYLPDVTGQLLDGSLLIAEAGLEEDKRKERNRAKAEAARKVVQQQGGTYSIGTEATLSRTRHANLVFLHARRQAFPAWSQLEEAFEPSAYLPAEKRQGVAAVRLLDEATRMATQTARTALRISFCSVEMSLQYSSRWLQWHCS